MAGIKLPKYLWIIDLDRNSGSSLLSAENSREAASTQLCLQCILLPAHLYLLPHPTALHLLLLRGEEACCQSEE